MATPGRGQFIRERFQRLVDEVWPAVGPDDRVSSEFMLFRRVTQAGMTSDFGVQTVPWSLIVSGQPCMYLGAWSASAERFGLEPAGINAMNMIVLWTSYEDVRLGDDLYLAADGKHYHVQVAKQDGGLRRLLCDSSQAQNTSP